jgi:putative membrane protein
MNLFFGFLFALAIAIFAVQNSSMVAIRVLGWGLETSLVLVIIGAAALGALSVTVVGLPRAIRLRLKLREYEGRIKRLEAEIREKTPPAGAPAPASPATGAAATESPIDSQVESGGVGQSGSRSENPRGS